MHCCSSKERLIRICLDTRVIIEYIKIHNQITSQDQLLSMLIVFKVFPSLMPKMLFINSTVDKDRFIKISIPSYPFGRFRSLVMPFGLNCALEVYQMIMDNIFEDCPYIDTLMISYIFDDKIKNGINFLNCSCVPDCVLIFY